MLDADDEVMAAPQPEVKVWNMLSVTFHRPKELPYDVVVDAYAVVLQDEEDSDFIQVQEADDIDPVLEEGEEEEAGGDDSDGGVARRKKEKKEKKEKKKEKKKAEEAESKLSEHQSRNAKLKERLASLKQY